MSRAHRASEDDDHRASAESRRSSRQSARQSVEELTAGVVWTYLFKTCLVKWKEWWTVSYNTWGNEMNRMDFTIMNNSGFTWLSTMATGGHWLVVDFEDVGQPWPTCFRVEEAWRGRLDWFVMKEVQCFCACPWFYWIWPYHDASHIDGPHSRQGPIYDAVWKCLKPPASWQTFQWEKQFRHNTKWFLTSLAVPSYNEMLRRHPQYRTPILQEMVQPKERSTPSKPKRRVDEADEHVTWSSEG